MKRRTKVSAKTICKIGTVAHNRAFTPSEFKQYAGVGQTTLTRLIKRGILKRTERGRYYPTTKGWKVIEKSCKLRWGF